MKNLILNLINASEMAALSAYSWVGKNNAIQADQAAVDVMRKQLNEIDFKAKVVVGEGERDEAPMLHIGEILGAKNMNEIEYDIAVDPLECTTKCAQNSGGSMTAMVVAESGMLLSTPDVYMKKIAGMSKKINLNQSLQENLLILSQEKNVQIKDLTVSILNRPRNEQFIEEILSIGAKIKLISDGDIESVMLTCIPCSGIDMYYGIGGAPEGIISAAIMYMMGGTISGQLIFQEEKQKKRAKKIMHQDIDRILSLNDMVNANNSNGEIMFIASGITTSTILSGIKDCSVESIYIYKDRNNRIQNRQIITNWC